MTDIKALDAAATLLPCPFCGCAVELIERQRQDKMYGMRTWYHIEGDHEGIGGVCPGEVCGRGSAKTAITAWNTRAKMAPADGAAVERVARTLNEQMEAQADDTIPSSIQREKGLVWMEGWFDLSAALAAMEG